MTLLSRKADYALLIVSYLYQKREGGNAREIAERFGLSRPFVANILKELCHGGYVTSHRGVKGGYALRPSATETSLAELLESIDESFQLTVCAAPAGFEEPCSLEPTCQIKGPLSEIHRRIMDVLRSVTLADVVAPGQSAASPLALLPLLPARETACCSGDHCHHPEPTTL